jgi:essential nuclear protein 1
MVELTSTQGTCTLREAQIISAVLARVSIPVLHSAAAIKTLCDIAAEQASQQSECVSATNFMLKVLLEKKYALRTYLSHRLSCVLALLVN